MFLCEAENLITRVVMIDKFTKKCLENYINCKISAKEMHYLLERIVEKPIYEDEDPNKIVNSDQEFAALASLFSELDVLCATEPEKQLESLGFGHVSMRGLIIRLLDWSARLEIADQGAQAGSSNASGAPKGEIDLRGHDYTNQALSEMKAAGFTIQYVDNAIRIKNQSMFRSLGKWHYYDKEKDISVIVTFSDKVISVFKGSNPRS